MLNLLNEFMTMSIPLQALTILWGVCVVLFYSSLVYMLGMVLIYLNKKLV